MDTMAPMQLAPIARGPFEGNLDSLKQNKYPKWFTEGKLGIWAHWGPQAVPMEGDWYARLLYEEGGKDYQDHLARYGHPSKSGYKDIIPLWKAEKWDPEKLMALYKKAGAKYFVSMGVHHDNFDLWNSTYHRWNAVKMGPHRDVLGEWQKAALKNGLHFGVSEHLGASFTWFQSSRRADKSGPMAGVPYDGNDPAYEDLYHWKAKPGDTGWYSNDPQWHAEWYRRIKDLVDQYHPDLLYSDGGIPFGSVGESLVAHFYNSSLAAHHGKQEAVYTCKQTSNGRWAQDIERGVQSGIQADPWQTDTSIGDWFYNKHWEYRGADWVIKTLVDVVSKNGNLLINVVLRPDGSLDPQAEKVVADMTTWMQANSESIYATTPWVTFGEGPIRAKGGAFKEDFGFTAKDIRYVAKGDRTVYATLMGHPDGSEIVLTSFAKANKGNADVRGIKLLGSHSSVTWTWEANGLHIQLPSEPLSDIATVLKITGSNLRDFQVTAPGATIQTVSADASGNYNISAGAAQLHGGGVQVEGDAGNENIGYWDSANDWASWTVDFKTAGTFEVTATVAALTNPTVFDLSVSGSHLSGNVPVTGDWDKYQDISLGTLTIEKTGKTQVSVKPVDPAKWNPMNLRGIHLKKVS
jgi:alpha-L-fucosidase